MSKRLLALCLALMLITGFAGAEGLFPSMNQLFGTAMPSISVALGRSPAETGEDGSGKYEVYANFNYDDYSAFGAYLAGVGAELKNAEMTDDTITVTLSVQDVSVQFVYNWTSRLAKVLYPSGTRPESEKQAVEKRASILPPVGGILPSAQFAVNRKPDSETVKADGITQTWSNFSDEEYSSFSAYLAQAGAALLETKTDAGILTAKIELNGNAFTLIYDWHSKTASVSYPAGTSPEREKWNMLKGSGSILPKLDAIGKELPSLSLAIAREPDATETLPDGSRQETYKNFEETDYTVFSNYLLTSGCAVNDYHVEDGKVVVVHLSNLSDRFTFSYDSLRHIGTVVYPKGSRVETARSSSSAALNSSNAPENTSAPKSVTSFASESDAADIPASVSVGDIIKLGQYEQDNRSNNGKEPIEWRVLAVDGDKALIISSYALDTTSYGKPMDTNEYTRSGLSWETSALRTWLNDTFFNTAFSAQEKQQILSANLVTQDASGKAQTTDRVFILSVAETDKYFRSLKDMSCNPTEYGKTKLKAELTDGHCHWWLRDMTSVYKQADRNNFMNSTYNEAAFVSSKYGTADAKTKKGMAVLCDYLVCVRPALWIHLKKTDSINTGKVPVTSNKPIAATEDTVIIQVSYVCDGVTVATENVLVDVGTSTIIYPNTGIFGVQYELKDPSSVAISVSSRGIATPSSVQFKLKKKPDNSSQPTKASIKNVRINEGNKPNVRSKPSTDGKIVGQAKPKQIYELLDTSGTWYKIRLEDGTEGWIAGGMATVIGESKATSKPTVKATRRPTPTPTRKPTPKPTRKPTPTPKSKYMSDHELVEMAKGYFALRGGSYDSITGTGIEHSGNISYVSIAVGYAHCYIVKLNRKTGLGLGITKLF